MNLLQKFAALFAFVGISFTDESLSPNGLFVSEDQLTSLDGIRTQVETLQNDLTTAQTAVETAEANVTAAQEAQRKAESQLAEANQTIAERDARIQELEAELLNLSTDDTEVKTTGGEGGAEVKYSYTKTVLGIKQ